MSSHVAVVDDVVDGLCGVVWTYTVYKWTTVVVVVLMFCDDVKRNEEPIEESVEMDIVRSPNSRVKGRNQHQPRDSKQSLQI